MRFRSGLFALALTLPGAAQAADDACPPQPQPVLQPIDAAGLPPANRFGNVITLSAAASLNYPHRSWVIRASQPGSGAPGTLVIVRLRMREDCSIYDVESRWEAPLGPDDYASVADAVARFVTPPPGTFDQSGVKDPVPSLVMDGTSLDLRAQTPGWSVERRLNHYDPDGKAISAIFRGLVLKIVPAPEQPQENWGN